MARTSSDSAVSGASLFKSLHDQFKNVSDFRNPVLIDIPIEDFFMAGVSIFALKFPSLLQFDEQMRIKKGRSNLSTLFNISKIPSDTQMRSVLDRYPNETFRPMFKSLFEKARRARVLDDFQIWESTYCLAVDGSGYFYSDSVHCENCQEKKQKATGEKSFYHQMLAASLVHPDQKVVIPVCPVAIQRQDGSTKNDCEQNAMKRLIRQFREDHPKLKVIVLTDALHSTLPCLSLLRSFEMGFILGVKPGSHEKLFAGADKREGSGEVHHFEEQEEIGDKIKKTRTRHYRFTNGILLNNQSSEQSVNFLEFWETIQWVDQWGELQEEKVHMSWITDYSLYESSARQIARAGRTRWKIENETFNTLKNQGYHFEHNFGHGFKNLASNMAHLMLLAFLVDQLQELKCPVFLSALRQVFERKSRLWEKLRAIYEFFPIQFESWTEFLQFFVDPRPWTEHLDPNVHI